jgi:hypothetical protein
MVAIYFEVRAILQSACNCFTLLDCESDSEQLAQPDLMLLSFCLNFSGICFYSKRALSIQILLVRKMIYLAKWHVQRLSTHLVDFGRVLAPPI